MKTVAGPQPMSGRSTWIPTAVVRPTAPPLRKVSPPDNQADDDRDQKDDGNLRPVRHAYAFTGATGTQYVWLCPSHADGGELLYSLGRQRRGSTALIPDPCTKPDLPFLLALAAAALPVADDDRFDVLPRYPQMSFALVVLRGGGEVERPFVGLRTARSRLFAVGGGLDPEDVLAQPLLCACELLPAESLSPYPPPQVLAPVHDDARLRRHLAAGLQVLPGEVEGALPLHRPGRAPMA